MSKFPTPGSAVRAVRSPHPVVELDSRGRIRWANPAAFALAGAGDPRSELLEACRLILPEDVDDIVRRCLDRGRDLDGVEASVGSRTLSWSFRAADGEGSVAAFGFDVTEWKESESAIRRKDRLLEAVASAARYILESSGDEIPMGRVLERLGRATGVSRVYLFRNHSAEDGPLQASQIAEWAAPEIDPQMDNPELQGVPYEAAGMGRWARELAKGSTLAGTVDDFPPEERDLLRSQEIRSLLVTPILVDGGFWGFMGFDDCERPRSWSRAEREVLRTAADTIASALQREKVLAALRESREQLRHSQRMEAMGRLAGGIAHDFNNLLTGILGNAEILLDESSVPGSARGEVEEIRRSAVRAARLTRQLLAFSRKQAFHPTSVDLLRLVGEMEGLIRRVLPENIQVRLELDPDTSPVWADPGQVEQVVMNLAVNARDAMPDGGRITIRVGDVDLDSEPRAAQELDDGDGFGVVRVEDTGMGMDEETKQKAFEPFFTTKETGTGMGLSIVYGIALQNGGSAWIDSAAGEGTQVTVAFPLSGVEASGPETSPSSSTDDLARFSGNETVLIVEDDEAVRRVTSRILKRAGYEVLEASSAEEGATRLEDSAASVDLVLTDIGLPDRSGIELAREIGRARPGLPILLMSGFPGQKSPDLPLSEEPIDFLAKPFTHHELLRSVRERIDDD